MTQIDMLLSYGIKLYMVFDGAPLPLKAGTEAHRAASRRECLEKGLAFLQKNDYNNARTYLSRAVDVTPLMAAELIRCIKRERPGVQCVVAPYEADAQMAFLSHSGLVDAVISEDSDCIPFGCTDVIFKLDAKTGICQRITLDDVYLTFIKGFDLRSFTKEVRVHYIYITLFFWT